jgi:hypothetical protein
MKLCFNNQKNKCRIIKRQVIYGNNMMQKQVKECEAILLQAGPV